MFGFNMANIDKLKVEKQAKEILDKFAKALEKVEKESKVESWIDRDEFEREEKNISSSDKSDEDSKDASCRVDKEFRKKIVD